jgi:hypothetical protein
MRKSPIARGDRGQRVGQLKAGEAVLQTAVMLVVTRHDSSELLNFTAHSPEDSQRYRKCRSARLQRTVRKGSFQYRTAVPVHPESCDVSRRRSGQIDGRVASFVSVLTAVSGWI